MKTRTKLHAVILILALFLVTACGVGDDHDDAAGGDGDTDYYGDIDADGDADGDTDADTDGDTDTDADAWFEPIEGDRAEQVLTNPFVLVNHDPFSTFAADVDTASYDLFRRDINLGRLPMKESVRLEEYVNNFAYDYPAPAANATHPFSISLAAGPDIFGHGTNLLRVGIQGKLPPPSEKKPANLVFLIDISGSMSGDDKLPLVKRVLTGTLGILAHGDTVSIVTYAGSTGVALKPTDVSEKTTIEDKINSFSAGGSTAGGSGINLAYEQAESAFINGGINHVILCTDGDFNVGLSSDEALVALIEEKRKTGITLTVLGFGSDNLNDRMMEKISNAGNGIYGVISSAGQADAYVETRMLSNLVLIAKDMKIQVEFNGNDVLAYRLLGYENRAIRDDDFRDDAIDAGEIGAGHRVTALYELVLVGGSIPDGTNAPPLDEGNPVAGDREIAAGDMVLVKVRYKHMDASESDPAFEVSRRMTKAQIAASRDTLDDSFKWAAAVAAFAEILKQSPYAKHNGLGTIEDIITAKSWLDKDWAEFVALFQQAKPLINPWI